jgi:hypothetical protein
MSNTIYQTVKESPISNRIVKELNAAVLTATFPQKNGFYKADLYNDLHASSKLVYSGSCAPINSVYSDTVTIELNHF